jgi:hypothetical protein
VGGVVGSSFPFFIAASEGMVICNPVKDGLRVGEIGVVEAAEVVKVVGSASPFFVGVSGGMLTCKCAKDALRVGEVVWFQTPDKSAASAMAMKNGRDRF